MQQQPFADFAKALPVDDGDIMTVDCNAPKGESGFVPAKEAGEARNRFLAARALLQQVVALGEDAKKLLESV